jgi:hypothetical protein
MCSNLMNLCYLQVHLIFQASVKRVHRCGQRHIVLLSNFTLGTNMKCLLSLV